MRLHLLLQTKSLPHIIPANYANSSQTHHSRRRSRRLDFFSAPPAHSACQALRGRNDSHFLLSYQQQIRFAGLPTSAAVSQALSH